MSQSLEHRVRHVMRTRRRAPGRRLFVVAETDAHEGPVYAADEHALYFTTVPRPGEVPWVDIKRLSLTDGRITLVCPDANVANGMALDHEGRLIVCEQGSRAQPARISRLNRATGAVCTVVDEVGGAPLNSPNDVLVARDGCLWFTDPSYGHRQGFRPAPVLGDLVYRHDPRTGATEVVAGGFDKPNGLALSPDEATLYVGDSETGAVWAGDRVIATVPRPGPDGLKVDARGRVYVSSHDGVEILTPDGRRIGQIELPGAVNFCFARNVLFITTDTAIWAAVLDTKGV